MPDHGKPQRVASDSGGDAAPYRSLPDGRGPDGQRTAPLPWIMALAIGAVTLLVFAPALPNGFVNWDDDVNIVENIGFRGLDGPHLGWMFTTFLGGHYQPLTWLSFALDHHLWGLNPFGYHLTNIVLHAIGAMLFFFAAARLLAGRPSPGSPLQTPGSNSQSVRWWCAALAAALFALHPLRVESVVWVTERRDVLSGAFLLGCLLAYFKAVERRRPAWGWFAAAWVLFAASLLSKAAAMMLPLVLLVVDVYPLGRLREGAATLRRLIAEKVPFALLSGGAALVAMSAQQAAGAWRSSTAVDLASRLMVASYGAWFYPLKSLKPTALTPLYAIPPRAELFGATFILAGVGLIVALVAVWRYRRRLPGVAAAVGCYLLFLAPVSGLAQSGRQLVADRYSFLSMLPLAVLAAGGVQALFRRAEGRPEAQPAARVWGWLSGAYVAGLALLTLGQTTIWRDSVSLWRQAVAVCPTNGVAWVNLGDAHRAAAAHDDAAGAFRRALELDPTDAKAFNGLGLVLLETQQPGGALPAFRRAVELAPDEARYRCNLAYTLAGFQRWEEAAGEYRAALRIEPRLEDAAGKLAAILIRLGRYAEAKAEYVDALRVVPRSGALRANLAWLLATCPDDQVRDGAAAVALAESLCAEGGYGDPRALDTLAAAYAETAAFQEAVATAGSALLLAREQNLDDLARLLQERIAQYEAGRPVRSP